jgi:lipopolysaccharide transport system ATP-binding protein
MAIVTCQDVWKTFRHYAGPKIFREQLASWFRKNPATEFTALKGISFQVKHAEGLAVVGSNGAGKSTLLSLVTGLAAPDKGTIEVTGRVAALLELGSGFHPDLTGTENVYLNASLLGFNQRQTREMFDSIVDFAGIGNFIHEPLRTFSSGMVVRLAFSIAVNVDPEILIIDEVLAVGDASFQEKCFERIREFRRAGKTFLCVSHNRNMLLELCDQAIWLDHGEVVTAGKINFVLDAYEGHAAVAGRNLSVRDDKPPRCIRDGSGA